MTYEYKGSANASVSPGWDARGDYRMPRPLNILTYPHAILAIDGRVIAVRNYPTITKTKALHYINEGQKVKPGWYHIGNGQFEERP